MLFTLLQTFCNLVLTCGVWITFCGNVPGKGELSLVKGNCLWSRGTVCDNMPGKGGMGGTEVGMGEEASAAGGGGEEGGGVGVVGGVEGVVSVSAAAGGGGGSDWPAVAAGASPAAVTLIRQSLSPETTVSPSGISSSSITPDTGEGTRIAVW